MVFANEKGDFYHIYRVFNTGIKKMQELLLLQILVKNFLDRDIKPNSTFVMYLK